MLLRRTSPGASAQHLACLNRKRVEEVILLLRVHLVASMCDPILYVADEIVEIDEIYSEAIVAAWTHLHASHGWVAHCLPLFLSECMFRSLRLPLSVALLRLLPPPPGEMWLNCPSASGPQRDQPTQRVFPIHTHYP